VKLQQAAKDILIQLGHIITELDDVSYTQRLKVLHNSSIGQHVRHTLEFFICLKNSVDHGFVNYDQRDHDQIIEQDRVLCQAVIEDILSFLDKSADDHNVDLHAHYGYDDDNTPVVMASSFYRELSYNIEHAVHHMALIKIGIESITTDFNFPENFGVASSTVRYRANQ
jgi:uncharacterized damage-inducible protein DinB